MVRGQAKPTFNADCSVARSSATSILWVLDASRLVTESERAAVGGGRRYSKWFSTLFSDDHFLEESPPLLCLLQIAPRVQRTCCLPHSGFKARSVQRSSTFPAFVPCAPPSPPPAPVIIPSPTVGLFKVRTER
ncbi:hypothetical protein KM043_005740 [Ampulex compressa]|nr:hypothetical protein KM043_005740 [Ampulex compressa]